MHYALMIPEIVANIIETRCLEIPGLLYRCLFINRLFFRESARILWTGPDEKSPILNGFGVKDLGIIAKRNPVRAQIYANFVRTLGFGYYLALPSEIHAHEEGLAETEENRDQV